MRKASCRLASSLGRPTGRRSMESLSTPGLANLLHFGWGRVRLKVNLGEHRHVRHEEIAAVD